MRVGAEIESIRQQRGLSVVFMCNVFNVNEQEYWHIVSGRRKLTTFDLIMFISSVPAPLYSIKFDDRYSKFD